MWHCAWRARCLGRTAGRAALAALLVFGMAHFAAADPGQGGIVQGRLELGLAGVDLSRVGPVVVFLEPLDPATAVGSEPPPTSVRQKNARFSPSFRIVTVGQTVEMPNDDAIYHNVFSYSPGNEFDLGIYPAGESRSVQFHHPGIVRTYCSIHENMSGTILVAPSQWYAVVSGTGRFRIEGVAPGRYRIHSWCERLPAANREVEVRAGRTSELVLPIAR